MNKVQAPFRDNNIAGGRFGQTGNVPCPKRQKGECHLSLPNKDTLALSAFTSPFPGSVCGLKAQLGSGSREELNEILMLANTLELKLNGHRLVKRGKRKAHLNCLHQSLHAGKNRTILLRDERKRLVGCGQVSQLGTGQNGNIYHVYLAEKYQGLGIGRWMVENLLHYADHIAEFRQIYLNVSNPIAQSLYEAKGFTLQRFDKCLGRNIMCRCRYGCPGRSWLGQLAYQCTAWCKGVLDKIKNMRR